MVGSVARELSATGSTRPGASFPLTLHCGAINPTNQKAVFSLKNFVQTKLRAGDSRGDSVATRFRRRLREVHAAHFRHDCGAYQRRVAVGQRDDHEHRQLADRARLLALRIEDRSHDRSSGGKTPLALRLPGRRANGAVLLGPLGGARGGDERARPCDEDGQRSVRRLAVRF